jgi:Kdo2-lipid IVA lauroyltransferase/acyltransferase
MSTPSPHPLPRALLHPRHWPMWLGVAAMWLFAQLPHRAGAALGGALGAIARRFARQRRRIAERNLALCFPELPAPERERLLARTFRSIGIGAHEFVAAWWGSVGRMPEHTTFEGVERIRDAIAPSRGVILLSGHFMTLELCGRLLCAHVPVAGMYRRHADPVLEWAVKRGRLRYAAGMFARDELRAAVRHLKAGGILWYAPDQDMRGKDVVFAPFFGVPAATITATHQLARLSGAAVIGFFHRRSDDGRGYVIRIEPPLEQFPGPDAATDAARVNALIERMVREAPDEYLWIHRRFKRRPPGEPKLYS